MYSDTRSPLYHTFIINPDIHRIPGDANQVFWVMKTNLLFKAKCVIQRNVIPHSKHQRCEPVVGGWGGNVKKLHITPKLYEKITRSIGWHQEDFFFNVVIMFNWRKKN